MKRALIYGLGKSGRAAATLLEQKGYILEALDLKVQSETFSFPVYQVAHFDRFHLYDLVVLSPGIPYSDALVQKFLALGTEVIGEAELAFRYIKNRIIAVTGTNGKSSVVSLLEHILCKSGIFAIALGNIGNPLSSIYLELEQETVIIAELSSYQLETIKTKAIDMAVILEITPDHLDRYDSFEHYVETKCRIAQCLKKNGLLFSTYQYTYLNSIEVIDKQIVDLATSIKEKVMSVKALEIVIAICSQLRIEKLQIKEAIKSYRPLPHRIEFITEIGGVKFYNDSKSTNIASTQYAVQQFKEPLIVLVGGRDKQNNYKLWKETFSSGVKKVIAFGEVSDRIVRDLKKCVLIEKRPSLEKALSAAISVATRGDTVLLSPGCTSFDAFDNYEHRGRVFIKGVQDESKRYRFGSLHD